MQTNYFFLCIGLLMTLVVFGQNRKTAAFPEAKAKPMSVNYEELIPSSVKTNPKLRQSKAIGDTLYYQGFANQIPTGWTVVNNAGNSNNWIWANTAPGGQYSTTTAPINSTTANDGFMSLPADFYNTPFPGGSPVAMDVLFQSPAITIAPKASVFLQWQQSQRYCCSATNELVAEVSIDGISWTTYDATLGRGPNTAAPSPTSAQAERVNLNVSAQLANQTTVYIRFRSTGNSHYYWMIDDVLLIEGTSDAMELEDWAINFSDTSINPVMAYIPQLALNPLTFDGFLVNSGSNTQNGVGLEVELVQDSTYAGLPGSGTRFLQSILLGIPVPYLKRDTVRVGTYVNTADGYFKVIFRALSAVPNQKPAGAIGEQSFIVSDSILSKDLGPYIGSAGPGGFTGGNDGDRWGSLMTVGTNARTTGGITAYTISILVANVTSNVGTSISPRVWYWNDTAATIANAITEPPIGSSPFSTAIDTSVLGKWLTLPLFPPANISPGAQYVVGWEQTAGASTGAFFNAARDRGVEARQPVVSNFVHINDASPRWGWVTQVAAIRLNLRLPIVGLEKQESTAVFTVSPNPSKGNFAINISSTAPKTYNVRVRNMLGQIVYRDMLSVNGQKRQELDLTGVEKGIYFVTLQNGSERIVKKLIVN